MTIDATALPPPAQKVLSAAAPLPMKMLAAKGIIPGCPPAAALAVVVALEASGPPEVQEVARATLANLPKPLLDGALAQPLQAPVVRALAESSGNDLSILPRLLQLDSLDEDTLGLLAERATEEAGEIIATNEALLLRFSSAIEKLYMNKRVRMSTTDRLIELAVRNHLELDFHAFRLAAQVIQNQLIPEPTEEPTFDDRLFQEADQIATEIAVADEGEDVCDADDEGQEVVREKFVPLYLQIQEMTVTQKIRTAMLGNSSARMLLVRDTNRLVSEAAVRSPRLTESEAVLIASSRAVSDDVLRVIASNRDLTRSYQVKYNLITNPRTPFTFSSRLLPHLRENDLRALSRSKNVPGAIVRAARQQLSRKG